jgi:VanZ family protein
MLRRALASPPLWLLSFVIWAFTLYLLSSLPNVAPDGGPEIPHLDKVMHFGYFMGGSFLFTTYLLLKHGPGAHATVRVVIPILLFAFIGALDEFHQTFTPGRSGNDPFDWLADLFGAATGIFLAHRLHPFLLKILRSSAPGNGPHSCPS